MRLDFFPNRIEEPDSQAVEIERLARGCRFPYWFPYRVSVRIPDTEIAIFRTRLFVISGHGSVSIFRTRLFDILLSVEVEREDVAGRFLAFCVAVDALDASYQTSFLKNFQMFVQSRARHFAVVGKHVLAGIATASILVVPIREVPQNQLGSRFQSSLLDSPVRGVMAH